MSNRQKLKTSSGKHLRGHHVPAAGGLLTFWNGLPTPAQRGTAIVADAPEFPMYWARTEGLIGERIEVVRVELDGVNYGGGVSYLDNRDGSGWDKVTHGYGSSMYGHRNVGIVDDSFEAES